MNLDEMAEERLKEERINLPGEEGIKWQKYYNLLEFNKKVDALIEKRRKQPKDWWHTPWYKEIGYQAGIII